MNRIAARASLPAGSVQLALKFERASEGARIRIDANGSEIASGDIAGPLPISFFSSSETMDIGSDSDSIVSPDYDCSNSLGGKIRQITISRDLVGKQAPSSTH